MMLKIIREIDETVIADVLALQKSLLINRTQSVKPEQTQGGFLVVEKSADDLREFIRSGGEILAQYESGVLVGYVMLTSVQVLERAYTAGYAELSLEMAEKKWHEYIKHSNHYIQQIAVAPEKRRSGVGQALVSACREMSPGGVAADILFAPTPFVNSTSYKFFIQNGFRDAGSLEIKSLKGFQPCQTRIVFWGRG